MKIEKFRRTLQEYKSFALDTMCFIYHFKEDKVYAPLTELLFLYLEKNELKCFTSVLTVGELFAKKEIQSDLLLISQYREKLITMPGLTIVPVNFSLSEKAAALRVKYNFGLIDAIHIETARHSKVEVFVTNDSHFKPVEELKILILADFVEK